MKKVELVLIPLPEMGHLVSMVETAKLVVQHDPRFSISVLIIQPLSQSSVSTYINSLEGADGIRFVNLPKPPDDIFKGVPPYKFLHTYIEGHKNQVKEEIVKSRRSKDCALGGFVVDMFCTPMIDVATQLGLPTFLFMPSGACFLNLMLNADFLLGEGELDEEFLCPGFVNPVPRKILPTGFIINEVKSVILDTARKFKETKGILVNTVLELESFLIHSLSSNNAQNIPPVYPVGPILNLEGVTHEDDHTSVMKWLDDQPPSSVVFLCFGSTGGFSKDQVKEIAFALQQSGYRFLWSLRKQEQNKGIKIATDYSNLEEILPQGFLNETAGIGKVIGWAPQVKVLAHVAVGGFISHCGWNSILESIWFGVPIAAWPMYAEQQLNAFHLVKELGLAVDIKMDYRRDPRIGIEPPIVNAEEINKGVMELMNQESHVRKRTKEMSEKVRKASVMGGGSSSSSLDCFTNCVLDNIRKS